MATTTATPATITTAAAAANTNTIQLTARLPSLPLPHHSDPRQDRVIVVTELLECFVHYLFLLT